MKQSTMVIVGIAVLVIIGGGLLVLNNNKSDTNTPTPATTHETVNMNNQNSGPTKNNSSNQNTATATDSVKIENFAFSPAAITVKKGTKVTWTNADSTAHTVTADDGSFDSKSMDKDATFSFTFNTVGTVKYHCTFHSNMTASVVVTE